MKLEDSPPLLEGHRWALEGRYSVCTEGKIWSYRRRNRVCDKPRPHPVALSPFPGTKRSPYLRVSIDLGEARATHTVHRLVAKVFLGPPTKGRPWVCHRDGNPTNNRPDNLYWGTPRENQLDRNRHGTSPGHLQNKLTPRHVAAIFALKDLGFLNKEIGAMFGIHEDYVPRITQEHTMLSRDARNALKGTCPPHDWSREDRCNKCGAKDWMT